ncbi:hypothetical protein [Mycoplasmopsis agassizii]|nr:hypothetical protein [Mycoplasmopsis agassizii]
MSNKTQSNLAFARATTRTGEFSVPSSTSNTAEIKTQQTQEKNLSAASNPNQNRYQGLISRARAVTKKDESESKTSKK